MSVMKVRYLLFCPVQGQGNDILGYLRIGKHGAAVVSERHRSLIKQSV